MNNFVFFLNIELYIHVNLLVKQTGKIQFHKISQSI